MSRTADLRVVESASVDPPTKTSTGKKGGFAFYAIMGMLGLGCLIAFAIVGIDSKPKKWTN